MSGKCMAAMLVLLLLQACMALDNRPVVLITGADNGTGYALAEEYAARGWRVIATCREPDQALRLQALVARQSGVSIESLDVRVLSEIDELAVKYTDTAIDVLINNEELGPADETGDIGALDFDAFDSYMAINVTAPLKITETFLQHVAASEHKKIITLSSADSSLANVDQPGDYFYRASKAAVNIIMVTMAPDLSQRDITVGLIAPLLTHDIGQVAMASQAHDIFVTIDGLSDAAKTTLTGSDGRSLAW